METPPQRREDTKAHKEFKACSELFLRSLVPVLLAPLSSSTDFVIFRVFGTGGELVANNLLNPGRHSVNFREIPFGTDQYRRACALRDEVLRAPLGLPLSEDDLQGEADQLHFGLFEDENLVACVIAIAVTAGHAKIRQTAVAAAYQRQGLGRKIMTELETALAAKGFVSLSLHARSAAVGFYEKLGYETVGDEFIEVNIPHRKMVKRLT